MQKSLGNIRRSFAPWADATQSPVIEFDRVTKRFGEFKAVDDLSLGIYRREFHALLGPSGCGKSTLLRMLGGFEEPSQGDVRLDGQSLIGIPPHRRPVNMMFQSYALFPHMDVAGNIAFGLKQDGMAKSERDADAIPFRLPRESALQAGSSRMISIKTRSDPSKGAPWNRA